MNLMVDKIYTFPPHAQALQEALRRLWVYARDSEPYDAALGRLAAQAHHAASDGLDALCGATGQDRAFFLGVQPDSTGGDKPPPHQ